MLGLAAGREFIFLAPLHQTPSSWIALLFVAHVCASKVSLLAGHAVSYETGNLYIFSYQYKDIIKYKKSAV